jgi:signal transduction histidine kinase
MILAHDLRVPLLPLRGRIAMIRGRAEREGRVRDVHDCDATTRVLDRLQQMIGNLLDAGRLEQGIFTITPQPIDLVALARQAADIIRSQTAEIDLRGPNELHILGDPERLLQILDNLLGNALRYSPEGSPIMIEISTETTLQGIWAVVRVRDQGPGIAPELLPQLFTRFAQGPGSTGLGLGLFLARSAAEAHGGTLGVEPIEGPGTCFRLVLPLTGSTAHE